MKTKITVVLLVLLVTSTFIPTVMGVPEDQNSPNNQNSDGSVLTNLREAAESRRDELLYLFEEELPAEILRQLQNAFQRMREAGNLEISDPTAASKAYLDTLRMFRVAWAMYSDYKPEAGDESLVELIETFTPEPQPQDIEVKIKDTKEKRIEKFQEKILRKIEEDAPEESGTSSIFDVVKSGFQNLNQLIRQGTLTSAVDLLKITMIQYEAGVVEMDSKEASKVDKTLTRLEDKLANEDETGSKNSGNSKAKSEDDDKTNNGNNSNNGNVNSKSEGAKPDEPNVEPQAEEKSNNGNGNSYNNVNSMLAEEPEIKEKSNNGNGNSKEETEEEEPVVEEKTNNGNGNTKPEEDSVEEEAPVEEEPKVEEKSNNGNSTEEKTNNGNGNSKPEDTSEEEEIPDEDPSTKEKSNNGKNKK